ncbi:MAG: HDIG domain-containing protein [Bacteroidales bacterium]|jgi:putative nucleotidyltransferase with HDIG domain|nr:HDIG domain-containing protein [Bacteroidales bacterium]
MWKRIIIAALFLISTVTVVAIETAVTGPGRIAGNLITTALCYALLFLFLCRFHRDVLGVVRKTAFILAIIMLFVLAARLVTATGNTNLINIIPFALIPVLVTVFYDSRLAMLILLVTLMLCCFMPGSSYGFFFINLTAGMAAMLSLSGINSKNRLHRSAPVIIAVCAIACTAVAVHKTGSLGSITTGEYRWFIINGLLIFMACPAIALFEKRFYFLSDATMLELSDSRHPLLKKFSEQAPGSYQHSLQVANLAEAASRATGANILLARTGALYHDIGKMVSPEYFIENQRGEHNPHSHLDPGESSRIIIGHVAEGVKLAAQYKLPVQITDFIRMHHGTTKAYFFYRKYLELKKIRKGDETLFTYAGPKPFSAETAIVMMADAVEAASRTLDRHTEEDIATVIDSAIMLQEQDGQYSDSPLTFRNITQIKEAFQTRLMEMHHARIAYPADSR